MNNLSTLGWIILIGLALFILAINLGLIIGAHKKIEKDNWIDKLSKVGMILRDPYQQENERYSQLSEQVAKYKTNPINNNQESCQSSTHDPQGEK